VRYVEFDAGAARLREGPEPDTPPGWARVRVLACGVCGTDLHLLSGMTLPRGAAYPVRPGHEVAGIVEHVEAVDGAVTPGDLVVLHPLAPCGACPACVAGEERRCEQPRALGMHDPGGFAEQVAWPARRMLPATGIEPASAALLSDAAATAHHALSLAQVPAGGTLYVLGAGGLGTATLALARALDPAVTLAAVVRGEASAERLRTGGIAAQAGLPGAARALRSAIGRADVVIDFSGDSAAPAAAARMLRRGGRLVLGSLVDSELSLGPSSAFMANELQLLGAYVSGIEDLTAVIDLAREGHIDPGSWITHRRPLGAFEDALRIAATRPPGTVRVVIDLQ
jgi:2-desacetyl-2-hydroxyethyl bacteriochlorophyllide A dehydrogenase